MSVKRVGHYNLTHKFKEKKMKLFCRIYFVLLSCIVIAWSAPSFAGQWITNQKIQYLYAGDAGGRYAVKLVGINPNPANCGASFDLAMDINSLKLKAMWAMLLTAYVTDKPISVYLNGCEGINNLPVITDISFGW